MATQSFGQPSGLWGLQWDKEKKQLGSVYIYPSVHPPTGTYYLLRYTVDVDVVYV